MSAAPRNCEVVSKRARMLRCSGGDRTSRGQRLASSVHRQLHAAFTLIEVLIVLSLMLLLAGIALPTAKELLSDQKASRVAGAIVAYFDQARTEAIIKGQYVGVRIERLTSTNAVEYGSTASIRLQRITGVPPYSGEAPDASVKITAIANGIAALEFEGANNLLLTLVGQPNATIAEGDLIELPGGRMFPLDFTGISATTVTAAIDLNSPESSVVFSNPNLLELSPTSTGTELFPLGGRGPNLGNFKYRIYRRPPVLATNSLAFSRGIAIDLNYSGIGLSGNQFAPSPLASPAFNQPIDILFGPDGRVEYISTNNVGSIGPAVGMIYLCLGTTDGVADTVADRLRNDDQFTANVLNPDSIWIVINPSTGRIVASPFGSISGTPTLPNALTTARALANLSDTLGTTP